MELKPILSEEERDALPEALYNQYEPQDDGKYRLNMEGVRLPDEVHGMEQALKRLKHEKQELKRRAERVSDEELERLREIEREYRERAEEAQAEEGKLDEIRAKWQEETSRKLSEKDEVITKYQKQLRNVAVHNELRAAIAEAGVLDEYRDDARRALLELNPDVREVDGQPVGVFPDEVHGDKTIKEFVAEWATSKDAKKYMPPPKGGGGGDGRDGPAPKINKPYDQMSQDEKFEYLTHKYVEDAA